MAGEGERRGELCLEQAVNSGRAILKKISGEPIPLAGREGGRGSLRRRNCRRARAGAQRERCVESSLHAGLEFTMYPSDGS